MELFMKVEEKTKSLKEKGVNKTRVVPLEIELDDQYKIDVSKLSLGTKFAHGAYSQLYHGIYKDEHVAVKIVKDDEEMEELADRLKNQFNAEIIFLSRLHHQNIVKFIGACKKSPSCIITEYVSHGSLRKYLDKNKCIDIQKLIKMALDIARGMEYIHAHGVIHKDLKSDNILIDENFILKIADFGISCPKECCNEISYGRGTYRWMAPELINQNSYDHKVDVYSYGVILWEMLTGTIPYEEFIKPIEAALAVSRKNLRPVIPRDCPPPLRPLIKRCWSSQPQKRPEFWQIVKVLEFFESLIACDGTLNLVDTTFYDLKKKNFFRFVRKKLGVCVTSGVHGMVQ